MIGFLALLFFAFLFFLDRFSLWIRGDCDLALRTDLIQNAFTARIGNKRLFRFDLPLENRSKREQALVIFGSAQHVPEKKEDKLVETWTRMTLAELPRNDGYFEATLVKPGKQAFFRVEVCFEGNADALSKLRVLVSYSYYGRRPMTTDQVDFSLPLEAFKEEEAAFTAPVAPTPLRKPKESNVAPIPTHLIFPGEDLAGVVKQYAPSGAKAGDWVAIAESVVAIAQGRVYPVQTIRPGFWARRLNRFFQFNSSLASSYSMEWAIREVGVARILAGIMAGLLGRLFGRSGDFYRVAGRSVAAIDDCTGTLPPFDKSVVLAPAQPDQVAEKIREQTGFEVAIVDANDLGKVDILGKSAGIVDEELIQAIRDNPQGNADEQTPFVLIRRGP